MLYYILANFILRRKNFNAGVVIMFITYERFKRVLLRIKLYSERILFVIFQCIYSFAKRKKRNHFIICGCSRSGTTLLYNMLRYSCDETVLVFDKEMSAMNTLRFFNSDLITKRPLDIMTIKKDIRVLSWFRKVFVLVLYRDPRDLVCSRHASLQDNYFQSLDYQFFISGHIKSFSNPGIYSVYEKIEGLREVKNAYFLKYEDLINDPDKVKNNLNDLQEIKFLKSFSLFYKVSIPVGLSRTLNGVRKVDSGNIYSWMRDEDKFKRIISIMYLFKSLEYIVERWGYPSFDDICNKYLKQKTETTYEEGTIFAFYTDDELYRKEAGRLRYSLDRLGLKYEIKEINSNKRWVENCGLKSSMILDARRRIRGSLLYLDVDAVVHHNPWPYLSQYTGDLCTYVNKKGDLLSASILINDTIEAIKLLELWVTRQQENPLTYDQVVLKEIIQDDNLRMSYSFQYLPVNLCFIFDKKVDYFYGDIIIEQLQASRESPQKWTTIDRNALPLLRRSKRIKEIEDSWRLDNL